MLKAIADKLLSCKRYNKTEAIQDSLCLLQKLTGKTKAELIAQKNIMLSKQQQQKLSKWLNLIINKHKPIQYIIEWVPFCNVKILVRPPILIPRPETEYMCDTIIQKLKAVSKQKLKVLDLCSGSGCIGISIANEFKNFNITCTDINPRAIDLIKKNITYNNIKNTTVIKSNLFEKMQNNRFDIIISNPPYISCQEWQGLEQNITLWEDKKALVSGKNGLCIIEKIIKNFYKHLKSNQLLSKHKIPRLILEIGEKQHNKILNLIQPVNFFEIKIVKDLQQKPRWIEFLSNKEEITYF